MSATASSMLPIGTAAPDFSLPDVATGQPLQLVDFAQQALLVYVFRGPIFEVVSDPTITQSLRQITATAVEARNTGIVLMLTGAGVGALSSALAVRRHLRV